MSDSYTYNYSSEPKRPETCPAQPLNLLPGGCFWVGFHARYLRQQKRTQLSHIGNLPEDGQTPWLLTILRRKLTQVQYSCTLCCLCFITKQSKRRPLFTQYATM